MMVTSEKLIKFVSVAIAAATLLFILVVIVQELSKPASMLDRISAAKCMTLTKTDKAPESEYELKKIESECILVPQSGTDFAESLRNFANLRNFDYLFSGNAGILLKRRTATFENEAKFILDSFRGRETEKIQDSKLTLTAAMYNSSGEPLITASYDETSLHQIADNLPELFGEIARIKQLDLNSLKLMLYFHSEYAYLEDKTPDYLNSIPRPLIDGLYIKSRGAKLRVLPWEYSNKPLSVLDRKGRQYGLEKEEYTNKLATIWFYRTFQFLEGKPFQGPAALAKSEMSPMLALRHIAKHLKNSQEPDGSIPAELDIKSAKPGSAKLSLTALSQAAAAMIKASELLDDSELKTSGVRALEYAKSRLEADKTAIAAYLTAADPVSMELGSEEHSKLYKEHFGAETAVREEISLKPVYAGIFLEAFRIYARPDKTAKLSELIDLALAGYERLNTEERLRFIGHLSALKLDNGTQDFEKIRDFYQKQSKFLENHRFDHRRFDIYKGTFTQDPKRPAPDFTLSLLVSSGLARAAAQGYLKLDPDTAGTYIRYLIVTDDDLKKWGDPNAKIRSQGGVRTSVSGKSVTLQNTARAAFFFIDMLSEVKK